MSADVRQRRADRVRQDRLKTMLPRYAPYIVIAAVLIAAVSVVALYPGLLPQGAPAKKFAHIHPSFAMYADGERIRFADMAYDLSSLNEARAHFHVAGNGQDFTMHLEGKFPGGVPDITLHFFFSILGVTLEKDFVKLDTKWTHKGEEWRTAGNKTWQAWSALPNAPVNQQGGNSFGPWTPIPGDWSRYVPKDYEKILITYGDLTPEQLQQQQASVRESVP